jgi:hypothetical protein
MSAGRSAIREERKALLATRAELDRQRVLLAVYEIREIVSPTSVTGRIAGARPLAATLITLLGPIAGANRVARWLRYASLALVGLRLARSWHDRPRS